jgi:4-hydroxybenzoate polyprenyltransferase
MKPRALIALSRPRFWHYTAGPFVVGLAVGMRSWNDLLSVQLLVQGLYFLVAANIFIYGVNDWYDADTDALNPKKDAYEHKLQQDERAPLRGALIGTLFISGFLIVTTPSRPAQLWWVLFLILACAYSAPPLRFKARPVLDFASNILYVVPGFVAYALLSGMQPPFWVVLAAGCWTGAMHLFSAVPDIDADARAGIRTSAVAFGGRVALFVCAALWLSSGLIAYYATHALWPFMGSAYALAAVILATGYTPERSARAYRYFPIANLLVGFVLFWVAAAGTPYG